MTAPFAVDSIFNPEDCPLECRFRPNGPNPTVHLHCAGCLDPGCVLVAIGGGGDDGRGVDGYEDKHGRTTVGCVRCKDPMAKGCGRAHDDGPLCYACNEASLKAEMESDAIGRDLAHAVADAKSSLEKVRGESRLSMLDSLRPKVDELLSIAREYDHALAVQQQCLLMPALPGIANAVAA